MVRRALRGYFAVEPFFLAGASSSPVDMKLHALAATHAFHARIVIGNLLIANGLMVTP